MSWIASTARQSGGGVVALPGPGIQRARTRGKIGVPSKGADARDASGGRRKGLRQPPKPLQIMGRTR